MTDDSKRGTSLGSSTGRFDALAEEFSSRIRRGERPTVEEYAARFPELAVRIRQLFPGMALIEDVEARARVLMPPSAGAARAPEGLPERIGEYRILREIGRGGMGIVYEAE